MPTAKNNRLRGEAVQINLRDQSSKCQAFARIILGFATELED
jgi:hypothetical protein